VEIPEREWSEPVHVDGMVLVSPNEPDSLWYYPLLKRCMDVSISFLLLVAISPLAFILAILVAIDSPGPVLFVQERVGKKGRLFKMYKFRSMHTDAPRYGSSPLASSDKRITRVGKFLRKSSIDELPQLINVFIGDMSLVGPRPEMKFIVDRYDARQRQRLLVLPGVTGLWQISADRIFHIHESIEYDLYYIRHRSFFLDIAVLMHTALFAARGI
jgi:lipopolysaccharide/colanic/teichoic acid biosynthesis glycosyltransferase